MPRFSIVVPYKQRLANIAHLFECMARQRRSDFEVVLGVMENDPEFTNLCRAYEDRLSIVCVVTGRPWSVAEARNLALRAASGELLVLLDADMAVPPSFLDNVDRYFDEASEPVCIVGQMIDYDNNMTDVAEAVTSDYPTVQRTLESLDGAGPQVHDDRLRVPHVIPWAFAWTALVALPSAAVRQYDLFFDEHFTGYGVEYLEWAYRIDKAGIAIRMAADVFGVHLPHTRNVAANRQTELVNYRYFLQKWPDNAVELAVAFGDFKANEEYPAFSDEIARTFGFAGPAIACSRTGDRSLLVVGLVQEQLGAVALGDTWTTQPLVGVALPFPDGHVEDCVVLPTISQLSPRYRERVMEECRRVSRGEVSERSSVASLVQV